MAKITEINHYALGVGDPIKDIRESLRAPKTKVFDLPTDCPIDFSKARSLLAVLDSMSDLFNDESPRAPLPTVQTIDDKASDDQAEKNQLQANRSFDVDAYERAAVLQYSDELQRTALLAPLPTTTEDRLQLIDVLECLNETQCRIFCKIRKARLTAILDDEVQIGDTLRKLDVGRFAAVCEGLKDHIIKILDDGYKFRVLCGYLSEAQCVKFFELFKEQILKRIKNGFQLVGILRPFTSEAGCRAACNDLKELFPTIIKNGFQLNALLQYLNETQCRIVGVFFRGHWFTMLKEGLQLDDALKNLNAVQSTAFFNASLLGEVLQYLEEEQCRTACASLKNIIKDGRDIGAMLEYLNETQCHVVCETLKERFLSIIKKDPSQLAVALKYLDDKAQQSELMVLLGRKGLESLSSKGKIPDLNLQYYRSAILLAYRKTRDHAGKEFFWSFGRFFQYSKTRKLEAVDDLINNKETNDAACKQGLLGKLNRATG